jgi:bacteriocin biosynthesis cyclodehydratase domain-containing protein
VLLQLVLRREVIVDPSTRPLLAPWYRIVEDGDRLVLEHGRSAVVLEGGAVKALLPALLPLLDGSRTLDDLTERLGEPVRPAIAQALDLLAVNELLVAGPDLPTAPGAVRLVAAASGLPLSEVAGRLSRSAVGVVGTAGSGEVAARALHADGAGEVRQLPWDGDGVDLAVVAPAPGEVGRVAGWNRNALEHCLPWLLVRPFDGLVVTVGPLVVPGESACYECLQLRLASHLQYGRDLDRIEAVPTAAGQSAGLTASAAGLAAHLAVSWLGARDARLPGLLFVLETQPQIALTSHPVLRVPRCDACSDAGLLAAPLPWREAEAA